MDKEKFKIIDNYLDETESFCPGLIDIIFDITLMANKYLNTFEYLLSEDLKDLDYMPMKIDETIYLVKKFLNNIDPSYEKMFDMTLIDGTFDIFHEDNIEGDRLDYPFCQESGRTAINLPLNSTIADGAVIVHEFMHYTNSIFKDIGARELFTELISIYWELRYYQFLSEAGYGDINFWNELYERLDNTFDAANNTVFAGSVLDIYNNTGGINKRDIKFIDKHRNLYRKNTNNIISFVSEDSFGDDIYDFHYDAGYLLGAVIAINLLKEPELNDIKIKYINENMGKLSINYIFKILDFDIKDSYKWIDNCQSIFENLEGVIYEDNNSNSRTYRSR